MAAHRADAHADAIDWNRLVACQAENLIRFRLPLPFLLALAIAQILVDPRNQTASKRNSEVLDRIRSAANRLSHAAVDLENCRRWIGKLLLRAAAGHGHLLEE